jgi:hypothetical protein
VAVAISDEDDTAIESGALRPVGAVAKVLSVYGGVAVGSAPKAEP